MRTIHTVTTESEDKEKYYEEDESLVDAQERYYVEAELVSEVDRLAMAVWGDTQAKEKRKGYVAREDFKSVFKGTLPETTQRIRGDKPNSNNKERLAYDVVLSAPKSVSMALHLEGDSRVFDAHMEAVQETLTVVEKEFAQARVQVNGERRVVKTGNLIAALIPHHTSRDGDMQLHTHTLIMNGTKCPDGQWRALWKESLANAQWVGSFYRQKLAEKMQELGYRIYNTQHGFELQGYSQEDLKAFSKRNQQIVQAVEAEGLPVNAQNKKDKVLTTRKAKSKGGKSLEDKQIEWQEEARSRQTEQVYRSYPLKIQPSQDAATEEVESAIRHLSERSISFSRHDIYAYAFKHIRDGGRDLEQLDRAIDEHQSLISIGNDRLTTAEALERELEIVKRWLAGQGQAAPLLNEPSLEGTLLNSGQAETVRKTLTSTDTHQIIHGLSGVGKTRALGELKQQLRGTDIEVRGFSPTIEAAANLQAELGIVTNTVARLVLSEPEQTKNQLWVIDEAGMVSDRQMQTVIRKATSVGARILLVGDKGQNSSIEAGSPLRSLINQGATTHSLRQIIRQQNSTQKQAVELIAQGNGTAALALLDNNGYVTELESRSERAKAIAEQYLTLPQKERDKTLVVTGTNAERLSITKAIRSGLKAEGQLGESVKAVQLVSRQFTTEEAKQIRNYQVGDYLKLHRDYHSTSLQRGKLYKIEKVDKDELLVSSYGGRLYRFNPSDYKDKEVFSAREMEIAVGDRLRWTATDQKQGRINGKQLTVTGFDGTLMIVADHQGKTQSVSLLQPLAVDYSLVSTSYRAQGQTAKRVIVSATSDPTSSQEPFYVKISRQTQELNVYTQDLEQLKSWVKRSHAQENPLELLGEADVLNQSQIKSSRIGAKTRSLESLTKRNVIDDLPDLTNEVSSLREDEQQQREFSPGDRQLQAAAHRERAAQITKSVEESVTQLSEVTTRLASLQEQQARLEQELSQNTTALAEAVRTSQEEEELIAGLAQLDRLLEQLQLGDAPDETIGQVVAQIDQLHQLETSRANFPGIPQLAEAMAPPAEGIATEQVETELAETLSEASTAIERLDQAFEQAMQAERLETLSDALTEWRLGQELADAILTLDRFSDAQLLAGEWQRIEEVVKELQSLDILQPELKELVTVINQERVERATAPGTEPMAVLAEAIGDLSDAETVDNSNLREKMVEITLAFRQLEARFTPSSFEGMKELAQAVSQDQAERAIATHLAQFEQTTEQVEQMMLNHPDLEQLTQVVQSLQETATLTGEVTSQELQNLADRLQRQQVARMPKQLEAFWEPEYPDEPPRHVQPEHWEEFKQSAIHPDLIALNAESICDDQVYERLLAEKLTNPKYGAGQYVTVPIAKELQKYEQVAEGGWWGNAGVDALSLSHLEPGQKPLSSLWGCYKPDNPRIDQQKSQSKGKTEYRKYENPAGTKRVPFLPQVSDDLAEHIYQKYGVNPTAPERESGFWYVVKQYPQIPMTITEGFKKTLASLSQGEVTMGMSGVNHIYRSRDELGNKLEQRQLNEEVAVFAQANREFRFAYDQDTKAKTIVNVRRDLVRGIELLEGKGCTVKVVKWHPEEGKGIDDLIVKQGAKAYSLAQQQAISSDLDKRTHYRTEYNKLAEKVNQELGEVSPERLDLEVYLRAARKGELADGERVVGESDEVRWLRERHPEQADGYVKAVSLLAGMYGRMSQRGVQNLDEVASKLVGRKTVSIMLEAHQATVAKPTYVAKRRWGRRL